MKPENETTDEEINMDQRTGNINMPHINSNDYNTNEINPMFMDLQNKQNISNIDEIYSYGYYNNEQGGAQPVYVNVKQLSCIQKRKARREYLDTLMAEHKNNYLHESRHRHAMQRKRAPTGRFLTKEESKKLNEYK